MNKKKITASDLVKTALGAALLVVLAPISFPVGVVPVSLATLAVYTVASALGKYKASVGVLIYLVLGAIGMPVFSGFNAGAGQIVSPTGGFIAGYIICAFIVGTIVDLAPNRIWIYPVSMVAGTIPCYALGTLWYMHLTGLGFDSALGVCVVPFLIFDVMKIAVATFVGYNVRKTLERL